MNANKEDVKIYCIDTFEGSSEHANIKLPKDFMHMTRENLKFFVGRNMVNLCQGRSDSKEILDKSNLKILSASDLNDAAKKIVEAIK